MDLTVEALREARFREGWRGYNPEDVDAFIDRVAVGVQALQDRLRELSTRVERAESKTVGENDETVKRTLVLAQRAADLVVSESRSVSERIIADARSEAARITEAASSDAAQRRAERLADIEREANDRRVATDEEHRNHVAGINVERSAIATEKQSALAELDALRTATIAARDRLRAVLVDQLTRVDRMVDETIPMHASLPVSGRPVALATAPHLDAEQGLARSN